MIDLNVVHIQLGLNMVRDDKLIIIRLRIQLINYQSDVRIFRHDTITMDTYLIFDSGN